MSEASHERPRYDPGRGAEEIAPAAPPGPPPDREGGFVQSETEEAPIGRGLEGPGAWEEVAEEQTGHQHGTPGRPELAEPQPGPRHDIGLDP